MRDDWMPTRSGRPVELAMPQVEEVEFGEIAWALAHLNRSAGNSRVPVSVGLHTLIGYDLAPDALRPWWLLHDCHEARTGEIPSPVKAALDQVALERHGRVGALIVASVRAELEARHDRVIHAAAGLPLPTRAQREILRTIDLRALATERRDFYAPGSRPWAIDRDGIQPGPARRRWKPPDKIADELLTLFCRWLPALAGRPALQSGPVASRPSHPAA